MKCITYILIVAMALLATTPHTSAQELKLGVGFTTLFDNKEYAEMDFDESGTIFSARLAPKIGIGWEEHNELMFGVDMVQDFGHAAKFLSDVNVQLYYGYRSERLKLFAGIFPRDEMRGLSSLLFFDRGYRYYYNRIGGVLARYEDPNWGDSYVEFAFDYTGMRDFDTREAFMIMSSGKMPINWFYMGYDLLVGHYARDNNPDTIEGVVDNLFVTPYIGYDFSGGGFNFDIRLTYIQSLQRDRYFENTWRAPLGGEVSLAISRWGVTLENRLYLGEPLLSHYDRYGKQLYNGLTQYATRNGIYNSLTASYAQSFFHDTVRMSAGITAEYDGIGWGTRQWLELCVDLNYDIALSRKQQYIE